MGTRVYSSLLWVRQDLYHQPYYVVSCCLKLSSQMFFSLNPAYSGQVWSALTLHNTVPEARLAISLQHRSGLGSGIRI